MHGSFRIADDGSGNDQSRLPESAQRLDPSLLQAAQHLYQGYCSTRKKNAIRPLGVAIDRFTLRGQLVFTENPVLLPQECFISIQQIESGLL